MPTSSRELAPSMKGGGGESAAASASLGAPLYLYAGSRFSGLQCGQHSSYGIEVEIQSVDLDHSTLCGYLSISGLTAVRCHCPLLCAHARPAGQPGHYDLFRGRDHWAAVPFPDKPMGAHPPCLIPHAMTWLTRCRSILQEASEEVDHEHWVRLSLLLRARR